MGRKNYNAYIKKQKEEKKRKKREEKKKKKEERRSQAVPGDMMAYLDEDGNIISTPPEEIVKKPRPSRNDKNPTGEEK